MPDFLVLRKRYPSASPYFEKPLFVLGILRKVVIVNLDSVPHASKGRGNNFVSERTIKEEGEGD